VNTVSQLQNAVASLQSNRTIVVQPGNYQLTAPLVVANGTQVSNVLIRGATDNFDDVVIRGAGMDNTQVQFGFTIYNAQDLTVANLSIGAVYYHAIDLQGGQGADRIHLYHCRIFDAGEQLIKSNPAAVGGADDCTVEYCLIEYTNGPSTVDHGPGVGYTNGISAHRVSGWGIRHNLFRNFHTPDGSPYPWNPVVLMWNFSQNTVVESNTFVDSDRAIALGLIDQTGGFDHQGGVIRNNFVYQKPGLFSSSRRAGSDGQIIVYDSPNTKVYHNTILTNGNSVFSIEVRWANTGVEFSNNLADAPLHSRDGGTYTGVGNFLSASPSMFLDPMNVNLHLINNLSTQTSVLDKASSLPAVVDDFDRSARPFGTVSDIGADEWRPPPQVQLVKINDGAIQRSRVTRIDVTFVQPVSFTGAVASAFSLTRQADSQPVTLSAMTDNSGPNTIVTLTFSGTSAVESGSLADGVYTLFIDSSKVVGNGANLDGDGNGTAGGDYVLVGDPTTAPKLFRLFGDADGNGMISAIDFATFRSAFGVSESMFDFNGDGLTNALDFAEFRKRFGVTILP